jgi:hypothetical protein
LWVHVLHEGCSRAPPSKNDKINGNIFRVITESIDAARDGKGGNREFHEKDNIDALH